MSNKTKNHEKATHFLYNLPSTTYHLPSNKSGFTHTSLKLRRVKAVSPAFTIVELLVVIVIIGILATITIVSYTGIAQKATVSSVQSDLSNASQQLKLYHVEYGSFPTTLTSNCPTAPVSDTKYCLKPSSGNTFTYTPIPAGSTNPQAFRLNSTNNNTSYSVTNSTSLAIATTANGSTIGLACPSGFIPVPGSGTYGTNDFCTMKYEAKQVGATTEPISTATGNPWVSITQTNAIAYSPNVSGCTGCHLITEAEWMTIAQNVLSVNANWSGGTVGTGCIFRGNVGALDACGYDGADPESGIGRNAKASLTLTNGEVIWDLAGNVTEWTTGTVQSPIVEPGVTGAGYAYREWTAVTNPGTLSPNPSPATTGITGSGSWNSSNGIGGPYSNADEVGLRGFIRGGYWGHGSRAGVLALDLDYSPGYTSNSVGFRVSR